MQNTFAIPYRDSLIPVTWFADSGARKQFGAILEQVGVSPAVGEDIRYTPTEREYLTEEEALRFIAAINHKLVQMFTTTLFYTG